MNILLTGYSGQLGHDLYLSLQGLGDIITPSRKQMDLEDIKQIRSVIRHVKPGLIISPAAYTAVAKAEKEADRAARINTEASAILAQEATRVGAALISYSTDYVFDGMQDRPYTEDALTNPLNIYGSTKLAGEEAIRAHCPAHWILRTSWVYSTYGNNFMNTVIRLAQEKETFTMVCDQIGAPTWSRTISAITRQMLTHNGNAIDLAYLQETAGTYHLTAKGETSWYGYATFIVAELKKHGINLKTSDLAAISPVGSDMIASPPVRPLNSRLCCAKLEKNFSVTLPDWQTDVANCIREIVASGKVPGQQT